jgi:hypothetical protein
MKSTTGSGSGRLSSKAFIFRETAVYCKSTRRELVSHNFRMAPAEETGRRLEIPSILVFGLIIIESLGTLSYVNGAPKTWMDYNGISGQVLTFSGKSSCQIPAGCWLEH